MNAFIKILLQPLASLYGVVTMVRNVLFDTNTLKSVSFDVPLICVGNAAVGGTGKTPHTEYIISLLEKEYRVACLSRGYKRKTKGFVLANEASTASDIGDEPLQIHRKFPNIVVACCEKRVVGVNKLLALPNPPQVIVLDDAFQHRYIKAGMNILLTDYKRPLFRDKLLPVGKLRENYKGAIHRATHVIVTKCPDVLNPIDKRVFVNHLELYSYQKLLFSRVAYGKPTKLDGTVIPLRFNDWLEKIESENISILVLTGIASPKPFQRFISKYYKGKIETLTFADHHSFSDGDLDTITTKWRELPTSVKYVLTTEKDAMRLGDLVLPEWYDFTYFIPITIHFESSKVPFSQMVLDYVAENKREC